MDFEVSTIEYMKLDFLYGIIIISITGGLFMIENREFEKVEVISSLFTNFS